MNETKLSEDDNDSRTERTRFDKFLRLNKWISNKPESATSFISQFGEHIIFGDEEPEVIGRERTSTLCCLPVVVCK